MSGTPKYIQSYPGSTCQVAAPLCKHIRPTMRMGALRDKIGTSEAQQVSVHWIDACKLINYDLSEVSTLAKKVLETVKR